MSDKNGYELSGTLNEPTDGTTGKRRFLLIPRLFCVLIAFAIWIYVMNISAEDYEKTFSLIDINVEGTEKLAEVFNMSIIDIEESKVNITVTGLRQDVLALSNDDFLAYIDVSALSTAEKHSVGVSVSLPSGVALVSVNPASINLSIDRIESRKIPVEVGLSSYSMVKQYSFGEMTLDTTTIIVEGPSSLLDRVSYARADLKLGEQFITTGFDQRAVLELVDSATGNVISSPYLKMSQSSVTVSVPVNETMEIPLAVEYASLADRTRVQAVSVTPSFVTVTGDPQIVETLKRFVIFTVDSNSEEMTVTEFDPSLLPKGIRLAEVPEKITVRVEFVPVQTAATTEIPAPPEDPEDPEEYDEPEEYGDAD